MRISGPLVAENGVYVVWHALMRDGARPRARLAVDRHEAGPLHLKIMITKITHFFTEQVAIKMGHKRNMAYKVQGVQKHKVCQGCRIMTPFSLESYATA